MSGRALRSATWSSLALCAACSRTPQGQPPEKPVEGVAPTAPAPKAPASEVSLGAPPRGLSCLARLYGGTVEGATLSFGGHALPWDDGRTKSPAEVLESPDLEDMLATAYPVGPIAKVTVVDFDPGRARVEALFEHAYGDSEKAVRASLVTWKLRGHPLPVHRRALPAFERVGKRLDALVAKQPALEGFFAKPGGTFNWRPIAGTSRKSAHSFGIAVDLDVGHSHYWRNDPPGKVLWKNAIPQAIVDAFEAEGFVWGGRWWHYDTMHFEWRPELFDPACRTP